MPESSGKPAALSAATGVDPGPFAPVRDPRWFAPLAIVAALVVALAVAAGLGVGAMRAPAPQSFAPDSASAVLVAYVAAVRQGDYATAEGLISTRVKAEYDAWQKMIQFSAANLSYCDIRVISESGGDSYATVVVEVTHYYGDGLNRVSYLSQTSIPFARENGGWKIDTQDMGSI